MGTGSVAADYQSAYLAAQSALSRLERASLAARMPATWSESRFAASTLADAREFDESARRRAPSRGRGHEHG